MGRAILCSSAHRAQMICERGMAQPVVVCASWTIPAPSPKTFCPSPQYTQPHRPPSILPNADRTGQRCNHIRLPPPAPADKLSKATPWIRCPSSPPPGSCPQGAAFHTAAKLSVSWQLHTKRSLGFATHGSDKISAVTWQLHTKRSLGLQPLEVTRYLPSLGSCTQSKALDCNPCNCPSL